jgi:hypothetical protein
VPPIVKSHNKHTEILVHGASLVYGGVAVNIATDKGGRHNSTQTGIHLSFSQFPKSPCPDSERNSNKGDQTTNYLILNKTNNPFIKST